MHLLLQIIHQKTIGKILNHIGHATRRHIAFLHAYKDPYSGDSQVPYCQSQEFAILPKFKGSRFAPRFVCNITTALYSTYGNNE